MSKDTIKKNFGNGNSNLGKIFISETATHTFQQKVRKRGSKGK